MMSRKKMIGFIALLVALLITIWTLSSVDDWSRDFTTNFAELTDSHADQDLHPIDSSASPEEMAEHVALWAKSRPNWQFVSSEADADGNWKIHLTRTTNVLRFVDDVQVTVEPTESGCRVTASSRSRIGKGDLGQNPRNLKQLTRGIRDDP